MSQNGNCWLVASLHLYGRDHDKRNLWCTFDKARDLYICPAGELLRTTGSASVHDAKAMDYLIREDDRAVYGDMRLRVHVDRSIVPAPQRCEMHVVNGIEIH